MDYHFFEEQIFNGTKAYFEKLPASTDDYNNAFNDLIAQYSGVGEHYLNNSLYEELMESTILSEYEKLSGTDKKELQVFYERNFLSNYYDEEKDRYMLTIENLTREISNRFKAWIDDNFSADENEEEVEDDNDEE